MLERKPPPAAAAAKQDIGEETQSAPMSLMAVTSRTRRGKLPLSTSPSWSARRSSVPSALSQDTRMSAGSKRDGEESWEEVEDDSGQQADGGGSKAQAHGQVQAAVWSSHTSGTRAHGRHPLDE